MTFSPRTKKIEALKNLKNEMDGFCVKCHENPIHLPHINEEKLCVECFTENRDWGAFFMEPVKKKRDE